MASIFGIKTGMTQVFDKDGNVIPVTVVDTSGWIVLGRRTKEKDGYSAVVVGLPRKRYRGTQISEEEIKRRSKRTFLFVREVKTEDDAAAEAFKAGERVSAERFGFSDDVKVAVQGISKGKGFQGVVKRHGFAGGPAAHGSKFHRIPGSVGNLRTCGNIPKGKKLPGHDGVKTVTIRGLKLVKVDSEKGYLLIKGSLPGHNGSLVKISMR